MATIKKVALKAGALTQLKKAALGDAIPDYVLGVNQDGSFVILGVDDKGNHVDISDVATLTASSSDPTIVSVDPPVGMAVACHGLKPGKADLLEVATWNDGSVGPYDITVPAVSKAGPVTGLTVEFGTPTIRG